MSKRHLWPNEAPVFHREVALDGAEEGDRPDRITVDRWTPTLRAAGAFLRSGDDRVTPAPLEYDGERLTITVANGSATYRKIDEDEYYDEVLFELVEGELENEAGEREEVHGRSAEA